MNTARKLFLWEEVVTLSRKKITITIIVLLVALIVGGTVSASTSIRIFVNGSEISPDVPPQIVNGRVLVPIRLIAENLGTIVNYDASTNAVYIDWDKRMKAYIGLGLLMEKNSAFKNDVLALTNKYFGNPETPSVSSPQPSIPNNQKVYSDTGSGHWISKNTDGIYIKLEDGSLWEVSSFDRIDSRLWLAIDDITVIESDNPYYPYTLINTDEGEEADAKLLDN